MLKRVVFLFDRESAVDEMEMLFNELSAKGIEAVITGTSLRNKSGSMIIAARHTLYITDNPLCYEELRKMSLPTIVYMHEDNRGASFPQAGYAIENIDEIEYSSLELAYLRLTGMPWLISETPRCIIRETTVEDVDSFYEIYKEPSITEYMENLFEDRDTEKEYIKDYIKTVYGFYGYGMWTVLDKRENKVIGRAGISWREGFDIPELGFVIAVPYQRQGYAYEVCSAVLEYGVKEVGFTSFQALIIEGNEKSMSLCRKLGFSYAEKTEIDGIVYNRMVLNIPT